MNFIMLAISVSIDALGIGLSYGMRKSKISLILNVLIGFIVFIMCLIGFSIGNLLSMFFSDFILVLIGSFLLLILGSQIIIKEIIKIKEIKRRRNMNMSENELCYIEEITIKDAILLAMTISIDAMAAGIGASLIGIKTIFFPVLVMVAHILFLNLGMYLGKNVKNISNIPQNLWSIISGVLLIVIAIMKLISG